MIIIFLKSDLVDKLKIPKRYTDYPELLFINSWLADNLFMPAPAYRLIRAIIPKALRPLANKIRNFLG